MFSFFKTAPSETLDDLHPLTVNSESVPLGKTTETSQKKENTNLPDLDATSHYSQETTLVTFYIKSKLGWIAWKEKESCLFRLFEVCFNATHLELKVTESLEEFFMSFEMPSEHVLRFKKVFKGRLLRVEMGIFYGLFTLKGRQ
jgi:hypothetical protein